MNGNTGSWFGPTAELPLDYLLSPTLSYTHQERADKVGRERDGRTTSKSGQAESQRAVEDRENWRRVMALSSLGSQRLQQRSGVK